MTDITDNNDFENSFSPNLANEEDHHNGERVETQDGDEEKTGVFTENEQKIIDKFKDQYMAATSAFQRRTVAQVEILPKLFNHWKSRGKIYDKEGTKLKTNVRSCFVVTSSIMPYIRYIQDFLQWIRNTWRPAKQTAKAKGKQYKISDVLWWERKDDVLDEVSKLMGKESADTNTKGWFELRMKASQNILNNMTEEEKNKLRKKGEEMGEEGFSEELRRK